jgi:hypothetical protein
MHHLKQAFTTHKYLILATVAYAAVMAAGIFYYGGTPDRFFKAASLYPMLVLAAPLFIAAMFFGFAVRSLVESGWPMKADSSSGAMSRLAARLREYGASGLIQNGITGGVVMLLLLTAFCLGRSVLHFISPFTMDPMLRNVDLTLHFGHLPHEGLQRVVDALSMIDVVEYAYKAWIGVVVFAVCWCLFCDRNLVRRMQVLWSLLLCAVAGTLIALVIPACGPVFMHLIYPGETERYYDLVKWLRDARDGDPALSFETVKSLYLMVRNKDLPDPNGIASMPDMHVMVMWIVTLYAFRLRYAAGALASIYTSLILAGSIVLGWHYGVESYAAVVLATLIWWGTGLVVARIYRLAVIMVPSERIVAPP